MYYVHCSTLSSGLNSLSAVILTDIVNPLRKTPIPDKKAAILIRVLAIVLGMLCVGLALVVSVLGTILQVNHVNHLPKPCSDTCCTCCYKKLLQIFISTAFVRIKKQLWQTDLLIPHGKICNIVSTGHIMFSANGALSNNYHWYSIRKPTISILILCCIYALKY